MFNQMSSKQKYKYKKYSKYKKMFYVYEQKQLWWNLILKQNQSTGFKFVVLAISISFLLKLNFAFCVDTFIGNFRLALLILTLKLNEKLFSEMPFTI